MLLFTLPPKHLKMEAFERLVLGIDMGTTSVKVSVYDQRNQVSLGSWSRPTSSYISSEIGALRREQEVKKIISTLQMCIEQDVPREFLHKISAVGVCGQMHGIVFWKQNHGWTWMNGRVNVDDKHVISNLFTWEDSRCSQEFIASLPKPRTHLRQSTGYGCSTIFWLQKYSPGFLDNFDCAGTIQDFVVTMLCDLDRPLMSVQNAASWGYFNTIHTAWNTELLNAAGYPVGLLPQVVSPGTVAGHTLSEWFGLPCGLPVLVAMGDLQCSILSKLESATDAIMNISTSAQLTIRMCENFQPLQDVDNSREAIEYVPYFDGYYLAEAPSLNGGNVFACFVQTIQHWTRELGVEITEEEIWKRLDAVEESLRLDPGCKEAGDTSAAQMSLLKICPTIFGERHNLTAKGSVDGIVSGGASLRNIYTSLSVGIIQNLLDMMPLKFLHSHGIKRIIGMGTALTKNSTMQKEVRRHCDEAISLVMGESGDAAVGAALAAARALEYNKGDRLISSLQS